MPGARSQWPGARSQMPGAKLLLVFLLSFSPVLSSYNVGVGRADITGPAAEIGMMGFAKSGQNTRGIHIRTYARAFLMEDEQGTRAVFVSCDTAMMGQLVKSGVVSRLESLYPGLYSERNIVLSATHTHSGPAGFMQYVLFNVPNLGFIRQTLDGLVDGITESIVRAHKSLQPGRVYLVEGEVEEQASINRSPTSYLANPEEERARYPSNLDTSMVQLNFHNLAGEALGAVNWFSVHPNSMNNTNHFISGDNKGAASLMLEAAMSPGSLAGQSPFVAAFASTNLGDVSPNTDGPRCQDTGLPCDLEHSTCNNRTQLCIASGPGKDMFESTWIIAERQYKAALDLVLAPTSQTEVEGPVQFTHQWVDMSQTQVTLEDGSTGQTCKPALGYSFAAGTTDGPGEFDFTQGAITGNPFWDFISGLLKDPTPEQEACHAPKPILLDTGEYTLPFAWHPVHIDTQILRLGQVVLLAVPGEFTTMAGRRLREAVAEAAGIEGGKMIVAGLSNSYTHYITTWEEYQKQRYEAASTIYGPHTLLAYTQQYTRLVKDMIAGNGIEAGVPPPDLSDQEISFVPGVLLDSPPPGRQFGDCLVEPPTQVYPGETVSATFVSGHLRNDLMLDSSFLSVEMLEDQVWQLVARDADWQTKLLWTRTNVISGESKVDVIWDIPPSTPEGTYRLGHRGFHKTILRGILPYEGWSLTFQVGGEKKPAGWRVAVQPDHREGKRFRGQSSSGGRTLSAWSGWEGLEGLFM